MRLRLHHQPDGARIAYRELGTGRPLVLLHSLGLTHREWEPVAEPLAERFRVLLPDLPLHGDSEDNPRHPYTPSWMVEVMAGFCSEVAGGRPLLAGHDLGAELALRLACGRAVQPRRLVLMGNRLHLAEGHPLSRGPWRLPLRAAALPGVDRLLSHAVPLILRPSLGERLSAQHNPAARDLLRHALDDLAGNRDRVRSWARFARSWPTGADPALLERLGHVQVPVLLLWGEEDAMFSLEAARTALECLPDGQLRTLPGAGFLPAYDDPVALARELLAFCGS
jgi:pimeloyl-ACP methyl ester carboxylesterase